MVNFKNIVIVILISVSGFSQNVYFSTGADVRNGLLGSQATANNPALDLILKFGMISNKKLEVTVTHENFNRLDFWRFGFGFGKQIQLTEKIMIVPTLEYNLINRSDDWGGGLGYKDKSIGHLGFGASIPIRYDINKTWAVELQTNVLQRTDLNTKYGGNNWVFSNFLNIVYKINL
jgi:hypothetical protein